VIVTLDRRLRKLEALAPPPPPPQDDDGGWFEALPAPVVRYVEALARECVEAGHDPSTAGGLAFIHERHPLFGRVLAVAKFARPDVAPLVEYQRDLLHHAWWVLRCGAADIRLAAGGEKNRPGIDDRAGWDHLIGVPWDDACGGRGAAGAIYGRAPGAFTSLWRAHGTTDPATLARVGFYGAALALLAADA